MYPNIRSRIYRSQTEAKKIARASLLSGPSW